MAFQTVLIYTKPSSKVRGYSNRSLGLAGRNQPLIVYSNGSSHLPWRPLLGPDHFGRTLFGHRKTTIFGFIFCCIKSAARACAMAKTGRVALAQTVFHNNEKSGVDPLGQARLGSAFFVFLNEIRDFDAIVKGEHEAPRRAEVGASFLSRRLRRGFSLSATPTNTASGAAESVKKWKARKSKPSRRYRVAAAEKLFIFSWR